VDALKALFGDGKCCSFATLVGSVVDRRQERTLSVVLRDALIDRVARAAASRAYRVGWGRRRGKSLNFGSVLLTVERTWCLPRWCLSRLVMRAFITATKFFVMMTWDVGTGKSSVVALCVMSCCAVWRALLMVCLGATLLGKLGRCDCLLQFGTL
jgi:hypothetical protein